MFFPATFYKQQPLTGHPVYRAAGNVFSAPELSSQKRIELFRKNYQQVISLLSSKEEILIVEELRKSYLVILKDLSFKHKIENYMQLVHSVAAGLMAFYECEIMPSFCPRISGELFGLIQLLQSPDNVRENFQPNTVLITHNINLNDWLKIDFRHITGCILIDQILSSHAAQIIISLALPLALISEPYAGYMQSFLSTKKLNLVFFDLEHNRICFKNC